MDLSKQKPSKNVEVQTGRERALAEYWFETMNKARAKKGLGPLDAAVAHPRKRNDPVLKDPKLNEKLDEFMRRKSWHGS